MKTFLPGAQDKLSIDLSRTPRFGEQLFYLKAPMLSALACAGHKPPAQFNMNRQDWRLKNVPAGTLSCS
jgi:hypothetical protein